MLTSKRPYLIRALNEWILDNNMTPHLLVDAEGEGVVVPEQYVQDGRIILNISPSAVRELIIENDTVVFNARFSGNPMSVTIPVMHVLAIFAKENGTGMVFPGEEEESGGVKITGDTAEKKSPHLKLVKSEE